MTKIKSKNIIDDLITDGPSYHVWQAVWLCEQVTAKNFPERKDYLLDQTGIRFHPYENYEYPPRDIRLVNCKDNEITFILNFLGLYGINSPLPRCYHEQVSIQVRILGEDNVPLKSFYDIFNNRFYWLYYQSWKKYRFHLFLSGRQNSVTERLFSFIGRGNRGQNISAATPEASIADFMLLKFSGNFIQKIRNKTSLKILLEYLFPQYKMNIQEFIPRWVELTDLPELGNENYKLGTNSYVGKTVVDYMSRICIEIRDIKYSDYLRFLPGTFNARRLIELLKLFVNDGLEFDFKFIINTEEMSAVQLGDEASRVGITLWLGKPQEENIAVYMNYEELESAA